MLARCVAAMFLLWPTALLGQVTGRFYLEKDSYALGEPVFLYFETTNSGTNAQNIYSADPYSFCSGYSIHAPSDLPQNSTCWPMVSGGSCLSSDQTLQPAKTLTERILLNYEHKIDSAGQYEIEVEKSLSFAPADEDFYSTSKKTLEVRTRLTFRVDDSVEWGGAALEPWAEQLHSSDPAKRREAGRTLASLAPKSLESVLLSFADNAELREWAPLAFHRLNTPASLAALARMLDTTEPGTYEHLKAADFLAETGDPKWFPLLLQVAQKNSRIANYVDDAAEVGRDQMLPELISMLQSSDTESARPIAVSALGYTGSRAAIPILLGLLRSDEPGTAQRALYGLRQLTHRDIGGGHWFDNPQSQYTRWLNWWDSEGVNGRIFQATECDAVTPLH
jgi:hypothetical protein